MTEKLTPERERIVLILAAADIEHWGYGRVADAILAVLRSPAFVPRMPACPDCGSAAEVVSAEDHACGRAEEHRGAFCCGACDLAFDREDSEACAPNVACPHEPKCSPAREERRDEAERLLRGLRDHLGTAMPGYDYWTQAIDAFLVPAKPEESKSVERRLAIQAKPEETP